MATSDEGGRFTLADANRNKLNDLEERFAERLDELEEQVSELEAENNKLRRKLAELKDDGGEF